VTAAARIGSDVSCFVQQIENYVSCAYKFLN